MKICTQSFLFSLGLYYSQVVSASSSSSDEEVSSAPFCARGSGDFVFRNQASSHFHLDACADPSNGIDHAAKGKLVVGVNGLDHTGKDEDFVYHVHCMHVDESDGSVILGTEMQEMAHHQKAIQDEELKFGNRSRELDLQFLFEDFLCFICDIFGNRFSFCFDLCYFRIKIKPAAGRSLEDHYSNHDDLYDSNGRMRHLSGVDDGESCLSGEPKGTLALHYFKKDAIGVKLLEDYDTTCSDFATVVESIEFDETKVDNLFAGSVDFTKMTE